MEETPISVDIKNLTKRYDSDSNQPAALEDISLQLRLGEIGCLLGPNGSGKTTLLKTLSGLVHPTSGTYSIMGIDPQHNARGTRANIGWMPAEERSGFYGRLTGRENLHFFASLYNIDRTHLDRTLGNLALQLGITDDLDRMLQKCSSGIKQKIGLARTLIHDPPVLLLDEPLRNLDPHTIARIRRLLKDHLARNKRKSIILSTHLLDEARRLADKIFILHNGKMIRSLTSLELKKEIKNKNIEDFYLRTIDRVGKT